MHYSNGAAIAWESHTQPEFRQGDTLQRAGTQYNALQRAAFLVQLVSMGFHENGCKRAALAVENASAEVRHTRGLWWSSR